MKPEILQKIQELAASLPTAKLLYFFGSQKRGDAGPLSDYDFAVYMTDPNPKKIADEYLSLMAGLLRILRIDNIDLVPLHSIDRPAIAFNAIFEGELIYEVEPYKLIVEPDIQNAYFDFKLSQEKSFEV